MSSRVRTGFTGSARGTAAILSAGCLALGLAACGTSTTTGTGKLGGVASPTPSTAVTTPASTPTPTPTPKPTPKPVVTTPPPAPTALKCGQLKSAYVGSKTISYNGYHDSIPLGGIGMWSGEDGNTVKLEPPCGIGDLNGDGVAEAVGAVMLDGGGTGRFWTLVVWRNSGGSPVCTALADLDDRTPVQSIAIAGGKATVVYLTRTADVPMAGLNIKRTSTFVLSGHSFTETGHVDEPYTP